MDVILVSSKVRFKSPAPGTPTRAIEEHYAGRRVAAQVDGAERQFVFAAEDLPFEATEAQIVGAIRARLAG